MNAEDRPSPPGGEGTPFDGPPMSLEAELEAARAEPEPGPDIQTVNDSLRDGVNRCPKCGSTEVRQRESTTALRCLFCRHEWEEARVEEEFGLGEGIEDLDGRVVSSGAAAIKAEADSVVTLKCDGCGAEVVIDTAHTMNARCHWCRHTLNVNHQVPNGAVPDAVLPFKVTKEEAVEHIRTFAGSRRLFAHKQFKEQFVPDNVLGVFLPYLVVDAHADSNYWGVGEVETRRWTEGIGDDEKTYYSADVYEIRRSVEFTVDDLTLEGSSARGTFSEDNTNNIINTILPFDTKNAVQWNANYLVGYTSEKRDLNVDAVVPRFEDQLLSIGRSQVHSSLSTFDRGVRWEKEKVDIGGSRWIAMYLPVWLYSHQDEKSGMNPLHRGQRAHRRDHGQRPGLPAQAHPRGAHRRHLPRRHRRSGPGGVMIAELMAALSAATSLTADTSTSTRDASTYWILAAGPVGGAGTYWLIYRYYRNQDKSHHFERDTLISAKPVEGTEKVVDRIGRTTDSEIDDGNSADHRERVQRLP